MQFSSRSAEDVCVDNYQIERSIPTTIENKSVGENPDPSRAQSLCKVNRPAAELPERTTIARNSYMKSDQSSICKKNCGPYVIDLSFPIGKTTNDRYSNRKCGVRIGVKELERKLAAQSAAGPPRRGGWLPHYGNGRFHYLPRSASGAVYRCSNPDPAANSSSSDAHPRLKFERQQKISN